MRLFWLVVAMLVVLLPGAGRAQPAPVVVELFTSQGCSSCPPADALLAELAGQPGVIALALHVDYWDYLGWKDSFADPAFSARQKAYAKAHGSRSIFTPQMVVQGGDSLVGHDAPRILSRIAAHQAAPSPVNLALRRDGDALLINLAPRDAPVGPADVHVVRLIPSREVSIEGGENAGQRILYSNIVASWDTVASWDGTAAVELRYEGLPSDAPPVVVIVQRGRLGPILTAASLP
jgi:hypothetical protein